MEGLSKYRELDSSDSTNARALPGENPCSDESRLAGSTNCVVRQQSLLRENDARDLDQVVEQLIILA